jgi:LPXTG-motif cell wall-anchored protein
LSLEGPWIFSNLPNSIYGAQSEFSYFHDNAITAFSTVINTASLNIASVPGPMVGAGLPGLVMALAGFVAWRRRRNQAAAAGHSLHR